MIYQFSILDMLPYFIMIVLLTVTMKRKGAIRKKALTCFLLMFVFSAIRYGIGYDYYGYMAATQHQVAEYSIERFEPLSRLLIEIGYHTHYQVFFVLCAFLTIYPLYRACLKLSINPAYSLVVYFLFPMFYLESFSIVRNAIAYSFALYSFVLLTDKKLLRSLLMIAIAIMFHKSAAIAVLIYPLYFLRLNFKINLIVYVASFFISQLVMRIVGNYADAISLLADIEHYADTARTGGGTMTYIVNAIAIFNFVIWKKLEGTNPINSKFLTLSCAGVFLWNVFLHIDSTIALRLGTFFLIYIIFLVPQYKCVFKIRYRKLASVCIYCFFLVLFMSSFYLCISSYLKNHERMGNLPYQTVFFHTDYSNYIY